jgi:hypothetical protein
VRRLAAVMCSLALVLTLPVAALADHDPPGMVEVRPGEPVPNQEGGTWEILGSFFTGNPHTDLDFFTQGGEIYVSVGTLAIGGNRAGQTIVKLTDDGEVRADTLQHVASHPSATCISNPSAALGLQHDVEATPKGDVATNLTDKVRKGGDAQIIIDATDARGRCHDQGTLGLQSAPLGGLEIVDITDIENPREIGLTSHIGEVHTVNIDPRRPHIAYAVSSDSTTVNDQGERQNEEWTVPDANTGQPTANSQRFRLDGFEVVDLSSCMYFPKGTSTAAKRKACRPEVYRYRYPTTEMALGHTNQNAVYGCHELEIFPNDRLTCGSGAALMLFDLSNAFDDNGTPNNFRDDKPVGDPLDCVRRPSSSVGPFTTGAKITDCVNEQPANDIRDDVGDAREDELSVPAWLADGAPSLEGVRWLGSAHHQGRQGNGEDLTDPAFGSASDIDFNHEAEYTQSRDFILATDERGGGVLPPGATCAPSLDNPFGNGGIHAYQVDELAKDGPSKPRVEWRAYARQPDGTKAIYRAPISTKPQGSTCTAHVFQQIPGQDRIFMGWYSQGTQVVDYRENADGTFEFVKVGHMIPALANEWVSHVFKWERNADGTITYYGVAGDFAVGDSPGRNSIDVWKATLPGVGEPFKEKDEREGNGDGDGGDGDGGDDTGILDEGGTLPATGGGGIGMIPGAIALLGAAAVYGRTRRHRTEK